MDIEGCSNLRDVEEVATRCGEWQYGEMNWWKVKKIKIKSNSGNMLTYKTFVGLSMNRDTGKTVFGLQQGNGAFMLVVEAIPTWIYVVAEGR